MTKKSKPKSVKYDKTCLWCNADPYREHEHPKPKSVVRRKKQVCPDTGKDKSCGRQDCCWQGAGKKPPSLRRKKVVKGWAFINKRGHAIQNASIEDGCGDVDALAIHDWERYCVPDDAVQVEVTITYSV